MDNSFLRIVAIDPGLDRLGLAVLDYDPFENNIRITHAETIDPTHGSKHYPTVEEHFDYRMSRLTYIEHYMAGVYQRWEPQFIVHETPFLGKFAASFESLVQVNLIIKQQARDYNILVDFDGIDPKSVKKAVGVKAGSKDKMEVMRAIMELPEVIYDDRTVELLIYLSEHASDAVAVGYWKVKQLQKVLGYE